MSGLAAGGPDGPSSHRAALGFALRLAVLAALPLPSLAAGRSLEGYSAMLAVLFCFGAGSAAMMALIRGERRREASQECWTEARAFCVAAALAAAGWAVVG